MNEGKKSLPLWVLIVSGLIALMEIGVSLGLVFAPESILETVDLGARGVDYLVYMWAGRQFALGAVFAYAAFKRSVSMLTICYIFFLVMFVGDLFVGVSQKENGLIVSAVVMCLASGAMLFVLNRRK